MGWATGPDGRLLLASGSAATVRIWDPHTGHLLHTLTGHTSLVESVGWATGPDGRLLLASGSDDDTVRIWDPHTGHTLHTLTGHTSTVRSVGWATGPDGRLLLASGSDDDTVRIWDPYTGHLLHTLTGHTGEVWSVGWATSPDGRLLLASGGYDATVRIWTVTLPPQSDTAATADPDPPRWHTAATGLLQLGAGGLWPPLSLVHDLIALTSHTGDTTSTDNPDRALYDPRLHTLADHPGIHRLRALAWPPSARVGFAALLTADLPPNPAYTPPPGSTPTGQRDLLHTALHSPTTHPTPPPVNPDRLHTAADHLTGRLTALLTIVGPDAITTDPTLPLRLRDRAPTMPPLTGTHLTLLADATATLTTSSHRDHAATAIHNPGSAGITHHGTISNLLPSQLALPADAFSLRLARGDLLYRLHTATPTSPPQPVTIILDTTPPTFGPVETVLRLTAHLLTVTLWRTGQHPTLITLDQPGLPRPLSNPADLTTLWTSRTLHPPNLHTALRTASHTPHPTTVILTHHHLAHDHPVHPGPHLRLLTTHPPDTPPPNPGTTHTSRTATATADGRYHRHLPPHPDAATLTDAIHALLTPTADNQT